MAQLVQFPTPGETRPDEQRVRFELPATKDYWQEREQQRTHQRDLLESLRYKQYARSRTLGDTMQRLGDYGRSGKSWWIWLAIWLGFTFWRLGR